MDSGAFFLHSNQHTIGKAGGVRGTPKNAGILPSQTKVKSVLVRLQVVVPGGGRLSLELLAQVTGMHC